MKKISVEFFPPRSIEGQQKLMATAAQLQTIEPQYFSVTYGAGGATRTGTMEAVRGLLAQGLTVAPHISCIGSKKAEIKALLDEYLMLGIRRLVVLRGDLPAADFVKGDFDYALDLVAFIRAQYGDVFYIEVAGYPEKHPESSSLNTDIDYLVAKINAGANAVITQYFYNVEGFLYLRDALLKRGVSLDKTPLVPGIMPITNVAQLEKFSRQCGADIPRWLQMALADIADKPLLLADFAKKVVAKLLYQLAREGVDTVHFYSLNQSRPLIEIVRHYQATYTQPHIHESAHV